MLVSEFETLLKREKVLKREKANDSRIVREDLFLYFSFLLVFFCSFWFRFRIFGRLGLIGLMSYLVDKEIEVDLINESVNKMLVAGGWLRIFSITLSVCGVCVKVVNE